MNVAADSGITTESPVATSAVQTPFSRAPLYVITAVAFSWFMVLFLLTIWTANPITLNRIQILQSQFVVTGKVTGPKTLSKTDSGNWPFEDRTEIQIVNLPETGAVQGETYLFPLSPVSGDAETAYAVTPSMLPKGLPLIYPDDPESYRQLKTILP